MADTSQRSIFTDPNLRRMIAMVRAHPRPLAAALFGMVIAALTDPAIAALTRILLDQGFYDRQAVAGLWVPLAFVGVFLVRGLATYASSYKISTVSQAVLVELRRRMFDRLLRWPQTTIENTPSGMVISKFINEASNALNLAAEVMTTAVRDSLSVVALLAVLLFYNWPLTLLTIAFAPLVGGILRVFSARLRRLNVENQLMLGELTRAVQEAHEGSRVIKVYDGAGYETERLDRINNRLRRFAMKMQVAWSAATPATQLIAAIGLSVVISLALWQARLGRLSGGEFIMFLTSALLLLQPLRHLSALNGPIARMSAAADSVFEMIDSPEEVDEGTLEIERARGAIEFQRVSFQYPGTSGIALQGVDLAVAPGETIALVGPSGAGKTTLINLIPRFIRPTSGHILIDGMEIGQLRLASLRRQVALVSQDVVLFDDTITANIAYGACRGASMADVRAAAEAAFLMPLIDSLPNGFDTRIGENAVKLSGGQRQRLSIARALLKDAPVLLLDEATSALDSESERFIQISLERLMRGRTTFVVAHRLSTIEHADRIVVLDGGRIVEVGRHADLLATSGLYASLYRIQFAKADHAVAA
ncbi:MAG TPA: lipid A export permease/ATP-binding protein MsbA [Burkholderiaceae bacterium]